MRSGVSCVSRAGGLTRRMRSKLSGSGEDGDEDGSAVGLLVLSQEVKRMTSRVAHAAIRRLWMGPPHSSVLEEKINRASEARLGSPGATNGFRETELRRL